MKRIIVFLFLLSAILLSVPEGSSAQSINRSDALTAAGNYLKLRHPQQSTGIAEPIKSGNDTLAWLIHCQPRGFVIIANTMNQPPIVAWSDEGNFSEGEAWASFRPLFEKDLKLRMHYSTLQGDKTSKNHEKWAFWMNPDKEKRLFEQWPPAGWSPTGGWLFTNWTQTAPYNALCPIDGQTQTRSVAGCPATAMAQIVNFHQRTNETQFSDADDYYHNFGAGNSYWIDNDWESRGFPSWDKLNTLLDTLQAHFQNGVNLTNTDKAALTYACGAAAKQVYSSSVSGTYGINQAYDAFIRFAYSDAQLVYPSNPE
ncbi:MAG: C10 family peptidase, partial [Bacteroidales bacterium]|nr:C10 family peptidase [Bacteroidales bacterium]